MPNSQPQQNESQLIQGIISNPLSIESSFILRGESFVFRPLVKNDSVPFGIFLDNLSEGTRSRFSPHPISPEEARNICANLNYAEMLRLVVLNSKGEIAGYTILSFQLRDSQVLRYREYGIDLVSGKDACVAPVIADGYQNKGIGTAMLQKTLELGKSLGIRRVILWQGTQVTNTRAIHFYEKVGFTRNGDFERYGTNNCDMTLNLQ